MFCLCIKNWIVVRYNGLKLLQNKAGGETKKGLISWRREVYVSSEAATIIECYSTSVIEQEQFITSWFAISPMNIQYSGVDVLVSGQPIQLE